jgi:hypothetical protein
MKRQQRGGRGQWMDAPPAGLVPVPVALHYRGRAGKPMAGREVKR